MIRILFVKALQLSMLAALVVVLAGCSYTQVKRSPPQEDEGYAEPTYYNEPYQDPYEYPRGFPALDPYGRWVPVDQYGWAWRPDVFSDWQPYYYGHWEWSTWGWTWISYEPFGWAVYHYGNWVLDPYWGWLWFPGYDWSANRVSWLVYGDYVCWAPAPIHHYAVGDPWAYEYENAWNVVHVDDFRHHYVGDFRVRDFRPSVYKDPSQVRYKAPGVSFIQSHTGVPVTQVTLQTQPVTGGAEGLKKIEVPLDQQVQLRELRTRTKRVFDDKRKADQEGRTKEGQAGPNIMTRPDAGNGKNKDANPSKQEPEQKKKKERDKPKKEKERSDARSKGGSKDGKERRKGDD